MSSTKKALFLDRRQTFLHCQLRSQARKYRCKYPSSFSCQPRSSLTLWWNTFPHQDTYSLRPSHKMHNSSAPVSSSSVHSLLLSPTAGLVSSQSIQLSPALFCPYSFSQALVLSLTQLYAAQDSTLLALQKGKEASIQVLDEHETEAQSAQKKNQQQVYVTAVAAGSESLQRKNARPKSEKNALK